MLLASRVNTSVFNSRFHFPCVCNCLSSADWAKFGFPVGVTWECWCCPRGFALTQVRCWATAYCCMCNDVLFSCWARFLNNFSTSWGPKASWSLSLDLPLFSQYIALHRAFWRDDLRGRLSFIYQMKGKVRRRQRRASDGMLFILEPFTISVFFDSLFRFPYDANNLRSSHQVS